MVIGKLFLKSISTGIITPDELRWIALNQVDFSRCEIDTASRLGEMVDSGDLQLGYRFCSL